MESSAAEMYAGSERHNTARDSAGNWASGDSGAALISSRREEFFYPSPLVWNSTAPRAINIEAPDGRDSRRVS